jgi:hypothetical protein
MHRTSLLGVQNLGTTIHTHAMRLVELYSIFLQYGINTSRHILQNIIFSNIKPSSRLLQNQNIHSNPSDQFATTSISIWRSPLSSPLWWSWPLSMLQLKTTRPSRTSAAPATVSINDVQTVVVKPQTETDTSVDVTGPVWYVYHIQAKISRHTC